MSFLYAASLLAVVLVAAPYYAHRLRRRRAAPRPFAAAHLVRPSPPQARRRSELEDVGLFGVRALAVVALALLGASPFVRCSRLAVARSGGASIAIAIVLDDSLSMQARVGGKTRFERARAGAAELLASTREGDAVAIVLAGQPARVALAPTSDLSAARGIVGGLTESDRATDLEGAIVLARSLVESLPQRDRTIAVLSDLADGASSKADLGGGSGVPIWNAMPDLRADGQDCAVLRADRIGARVAARVACTPGAPAVQRKIVLLAGGQPVAEEVVQAAETLDVSLPVRARDPRADEPGFLVVHLVGDDAVPADDDAPVVAEAAPGSIAVVVPADSESAATGGAPVVEQALAALELGMSIRPLPTVPDRPEDLASFSALLLDDPAGMTPEERRSVASFVEHGGLTLLALGPRAAGAPLGATLAPFVADAVRWEPTTSRGADLRSAVAPIAESGAGFSELHATHRSVLSPDDVAKFTRLVAWSDGAPLVLRRSMGRGEVWITTLPFSLDASDGSLRPGYLGLLHAWVVAARGRSVPRRTEVGATWAFPHARDVTVRGPAGDLSPQIAREGELHMAPSRIGLYRLRVDGREEIRVGEAVAREVDLRPRRLDARADSMAHDGSRAAVDASPALALAVLALLFVELVLRLRIGSAVRPALDP